jgi:phage terminase small subunit
MWDATTKRLSRGEPFSRLTRGRTIRTVNPPDGIGLGVGAWRNAVKTLEAIGEDPEHYRVPLRLYAESIDRAQRIRREWERDGRPVLCVGSRGQVAPHPFLKAMREAEAHSLALSEALLLTPQSRTRAARARGGRRMGASPAADRNARIRLAT